MTERKKLGIVPSPAELMESSQQAIRDYQDRIGEIAPAAARDYAAEGFTREKIACNRGPTYEFWGKLLGEHTTNPKGDRTKWTEIRLWETPSGKWVVESAGCSDEPGHVDIADAVHIRGPIVLIDRQSLQDFAEQTPEIRSMEFQAMDFWGWSSPAKALAKKLGWNLKVQLD